MSGPVHIVCPHCRAINRVPSGRPAAVARCGQCHKDLFTAQPVEVDEAGFSFHISRNDIPVLVDVWAPWCGPCRSMAPQFARAALVLEPSVRLLKLNADNAPAVSAQFAVRSIPTMLLLHVGKLVGTVSGAMESGAIVAWVQDRLRAA